MKSHTEVISRTEIALIKGYSLGCNLALMQNNGFAVINNFMSVALSLELLESNNMLSESHVDDLMKVVNILK